MLHPVILYPVKRQTRKWWLGYGDYSCKYDVTEIKTPMKQPGGTLAIPSFARENMERPFSRIPSTSRRREDKVVKALMRFLFQIQTGGGNNSCSLINVNVCVKKGRQETTFIHGAVRTYYLTNNKHLKKIKKKTWTQSRKTQDHPLTKMYSECCRRI